MDKVKEKQFRFNDIKEEGLSLKPIWRNCL